MKKIKKLVLMLVAAGLVGMLAGCDISSSSGGGEPATGGKIEKKKLLLVKQLLLKQLKFMLWKLL